MKRLMMITMMVTLFLISGGLHAQDWQKNKRNQKTESIQQTKRQQKKFKEVKTGDIPNAVQKAVEKKFGKTKITKAYINKRGKIYKLKLQTEKRMMKTSKNKKQMNPKNEKGLKTVYFTADGKMLQGSKSKGNHLKDRGGRLGH